MSGPNSSSFSMALSIHCRERGSTDAISPWRPTSHAEITSDKSDLATFPIGRFGSYCVSNCHLSIASLKPLNRVLTGSNSMIYPQHGLFPQNLTGVEFFAAPEPTVLALKLPSLKF